VGFLGLGNMGKGMADNLSQKGHKLVVYDVVQQAAEAAKAKGAVVATSPAGVAAECSEIVTMLPNNDAVLAAYLDDKTGILSKVKAGSLLIDSSTVDPKVSVEVAAAASEKGAVFVDAPVSGGVNAANAGALTFMVGAAEDAHYQRAKALLAAMGKNVTHCGQVGTGQAVKICNNMLLAVSMIGVSEAMNLGQQLGLDAKLLAGILGAATGRCWSVDTYNPVPGVMENVPSSNEYKGGFGSALMLKDLGLAQDASTRVGAATPMGSLAHQVYRIMVARGYGGKDFSSCYQFIKEEDKK